MLPVIVIGSGMSGAACARALSDAGVQVVVRERGRAPGGRLASPELHGRRVDLGAAYFTVRDHDFRDLVSRWETDGLARGWTDTVTVSGPDGVEEQKSGPLRWSAPGGLRGLGRDLLSGLDVRTGTAVQAVDAAARTVDGEPSAAVVLAMPDPQAARLVGAVPGAVDFEPVIAVAAGWAQRCWPFADASFVHDDPDLSLVADDGARRGDGAAVLVAHTTPQRAARHLADPDSAVTPVLEALRRVFAVDVSPDWTHAHRWTFAKPSAQHDTTFAQIAPGVFVCGDSWCPQGSPRVESAWRSGTDCAAAVRALLA